MAALSLTHDANADSPLEIDACALLQPAEIETAIGSPVGSGVRDDAGMTTEGAYSSTCIWEIASKSADSAGPSAPVGSKRFVMLLAMRWPAGSASANRFLESFREAARSGVIPKAPRPRDFGDEALQWGDGLAVRKGEISFGISMVLPGVAPASKEGMAEHLAPLVLRRLVPLTSGVPAASCHILIPCKSIFSKEA